MKLLGKLEVASVKLFKIEVSEDELDIYERCMRYLHNTLSSTEIANICGAYEDELQDIYQQVSTLLEEHTDLR